MSPTLRKAADWHPGIPGDASIRSPFAQVGYGELAQGNPQGKNKIGVSGKGVGGRDQKTTCNRRLLRHHTEMNLKPIPDNDGYFATECGRVFSTRNHGHLHEMSQWINANGYPSCKLRVNKKTKEFRVHRLIARAWCDGYSPSLTVNHKDGNKKNNHATNLEWITQGDNIRHSVLIGIKTHKTLTTGFGRSIWRDAGDGVIIRSVSIRQACREIGVPPDRGGPHIHAAINGKYPRAYKFKWGYV